MVGVAVVRRPGMSTTVITKMKVGTESGSGFHRQGHRTASPGSAGNGHVQHVGIGNQHMPLIRCPDCSRDVSDEAPACLSCGGPITLASTPVVTVADRQPDIPSEQSAGLRQLAKVLAVAGLAFLVVAGV